MKKQRFPTPFYPNAFEVACPSFFAKDHKCSSGNDGDAIQVFELRSHIKQPINMVRLPEKSGPHEDEHRSLSNYRFLWSPTFGACGFVSGPK